MDILYINLATQGDRRRSLESNFQASNDLQWSLHRVDAIPSSAAANQIQGRLRDSEKACFQSHIKAIEIAQQTTGHVLIAEDDILFGTRSLQAIESAIELISEDSWDIIFTDVCVTNTHAMIDLLLLRRRASNDPKFKLINLSRLPFAGATAYIVNRMSKNKILDLLPPNGPLEIPYDVYLQQAIHNNKLRAFVTFPFATSLSPYADNSQIQQSCNVQQGAMNAFRRLMWLEREIDIANETINKIHAGIDDAETVAFLKILAVFLSPDFATK